MDLLNNINVKKVLAPSAGPSDDTPQVGTIIDHAGSEAACYVIQTGSIADSNATFAVLLEESDSSDLSGGNAVADADMVGTEALAAFQFDDDSECRKLGYIGTKR